MSLTIILIVVTVLISIAAFNNHELLNKLLLWPAKMTNPVELYRLLTAGFVHADYMHLGFNMLTFYFFGTYLEEIIGMEKMLALYITGIIISCIPSMIKKRNNINYRSLGASGGVAAIVFAMIYLAPWHNIYLFYILPIPSIIFAILYLVYTASMSKKGGGIINHDAHLWGSVYGFIFMIIVVDPSHGKYFFNAIIAPFV